MKWFFQSCLSIERCVLKAGIVTTITVFYDMNNIIKRVMF